jgi:hypothetical protein
VKHKSNACNWSLAEEDEHELDVAEIDASMDAISQSQGIFNPNNCLYCAY